MTVTPYDHCSIQENQHNHFDVGSHAYAHTPPTFYTGLGKGRNGGHVCDCTQVLKLCFAARAACQADSSAENLKTTSL